jgi:hypothetical protein
MTERARQEFEPVTFGSVDRTRSGSDSLRRAVSRWPAATLAAAISGNAGVDCQEAATLREPGRGLFAAAGWPNYPWPSLSAGWEGQRGAPAPRASSRAESRSAASGALGTRDACPSSTAGAVRGTLPTLAPRAEASVIAFRLTPHDRQTSPNQSYGTPRAARRRSACSAAMACRSRPGFWHQRVARSFARSLCRSRHATRAARVRWSSSGHSSSPSSDRATRNR